jgi:hypothetical protein
VRQLSRKCGSLNISKPYGPSQLVTGIALPYFTCYKWFIDVNVRAAAVVVVVVVVVVVFYMSCKNPASTGQIT